MTSLIKNQILKHLTKFFKDLAPEQLQLSAFKGSCELSNLQLEEKVLMELLSFPAWMRINKAACDQLSIKIPWTKIKSVPIQMNLNEVMVEVEVCDDFRDINALEEELNLALNLINNAQAPGKYGFVDRVIDGITVTVNNVLITFKSKLMSATFNLSRVILESRCPNWKPGELSLTRIKDAGRSQILLFKIVEWQTMRLEAKCLTDPLQAPLRLITNHAQCRLTIKKKLDDCSVVAARIFVIFEDILWVLTFAQFISAASFVEYIFTLIKKSPMSKKTGLFDTEEERCSSAQPLSTSNSSSANTSTSSFNVSQSTSLISPVHTTHHDKAPLLTGNLSSASLLEQKFRCYDLIETSMHLYIDKVDAHLYDDIENNGNSGGALQTTFDQIQVDCYPYSRAISDRKHWYKWFDPSPNSRKQWLSSHFAEFDINQMQQEEEEEASDDGKSKPKKISTASNEQLLSLTVLVKIKDYCMNCVATKNLVRGAGLNKFIETDKDYHMPSEMPSLYLELDYFYYFDVINRMMVYTGVPEPLAFVHLSPTKLLFDSLTLLFLNSFQANLSKALLHLNDLFPDDTTAPKIHCRVEILMPQISLPAKPTKNPDADTNSNQSLPSTLLVKSGKVTLSNSIYDKNVLSKLMETIDKLKENPSQPINLGGLHQATASKKDNSCIGEWTKVWNQSLMSNINETNVQNQLWSIQFEPVWMDFLNYDVDELTSNQRLEPIVEPVNAYAFIHLNLTNSSKDSIRFENRSGETSDKRDIISILATVMDGSILANMDKVQFGFLQRLGLQVEKLFQQIKADSSSILQLDTVIEDTLELNLTAYIRDIKARLILGKKVELQSITQSDDKMNNSNNKDETSTCSISSSFKSQLKPNLNNNYFGLQPSIKNPFRDVNMKSPEEEFVVYGGTNVEPISSHMLDHLDDDELDECAEVADDASCLIVDDGKDKEDSATKPTSEAKEKRPSPIEESLLINLDEMEQSSCLFAKVDLKPTSSKSATPQPEQISVSQVKHQEIEIESISYLELSMNQLMVRRITETKRRQKF